MSIIEAYMLAKMERELERFKMEEDLLRRANAGEIYYDTSNIVERTFTDCEGNETTVSVGQWRERKP